jgi:hypothetical protein
MNKTDILFTENNFTNTIISYFEEKEKHSDDLVDIYESVMRKHQTNLNEQTKIQEEYTKCNKYLHLHLSKKMLSNTLQKIQIDYMTCYNNIRKMNYIRMELPHFPRFSQMITEDNIMNEEIQENLNINLILSKNECILFKYGKNLLDKLHQLEYVSLTMVFVEQQFKHDIAVVNKFQTFFENMTKQNVQEYIIKLKEPSNSDHIYQLCKMYYINNNRYCMQNENYNNTTKDNLEIFTKLNATYLLDKLCNKYIHIDSELSSYYNAYTMVYQYIVQNELYKHNREIYNIINHDSIPFTPSVDNLVPLSQNEQLTPTHTSCSFCLEEVNNKGEGKTRETMETEKNVHQCGDIKHIAHKECIKNWIKQGHIECTVCRQPMKFNNSNNCAIKSYEFYESQ